MASSTSAEVGRLADQLERSFHGGAWHGPATREALAGIDATTAGRRPVGSAHTIIELTRHITFWLDAAHLRIVGGRDVDSDADWPEQETLTAQAWERAVAKLERAHAKLHGALLELADARLDDAVPGLDPTVRGLLLGTLQHNAFHTGQIVQIARELST
jgi:uncharacterized damage-inducible protein DinB